MKKIFFVFAFALVVSGILAQTRTYAPSLVSPSNSAVDQMPNALLNWEPVTGDFGLYYKIQIAITDSFANPVTLTSAVTTVNAHELLFGKKAPIKVTIDEAVEIAKEFGNDTSHKFVNGVLGTVVDKYLKNEKK